MELVDQYAYACYLAEQDKGRSELYRYMGECILLSESGDIKGITAVNESFGDKLKAAIARVLEILSRLWGKFLETMNTLFQRDKGYLEKYREIILKKKRPEDYERTMYNYFQGQKILLNTPVPNFNYNLMKDELNDAKVFERKHFNHVVGSNKEYKLEELAKNTFRGGSEEITIRTSAMNMTDIFNYCYTYPKIKEIISKDSKNIALAGKEAMDQIDKMVREGKVQSESVFNNPKFYSAVYETYITEEENPVNGEKKPKEVPVSNPAQPANGNGRESNPSKAYKPMTGEKDTKINNGENGTQANDGETAKATSNRIDVYMKSCGAIMTAKMQVAEETYKEYMDIIRAHVRDIVGKKADAKSADIASNQNAEGAPSSDDKNASAEVVKKANNSINSLAGKVSTGAKNLYNKAKNKLSRKKQNVKESIDFLYNSGDE